MRPMKKILLGFASLIVILTLAGFFLPRHYAIARSIEISAPPEKIYPYIEDPREWAKWAVWNQRDLEMEITYAGAEKGEGARWSWKSRSQGDGGMVFVKAEAPRLIEYKLSFPEFNMTSDGKLELISSGATTKVTWTNEGDAGASPLARYSALLMDVIVGPDLEAGLKNIKALAEK